MLELLRDPLPLSLGDLRQVALLSKAHRALRKAWRGFLQFKQENFGAVSAGLICCHVLETSSNNCLKEREVWAVRALESRVFFSVHAP